jgi:hypothetical protein
MTAKGFNFIVGPGKNVILPIIRELIPSISNRRPGIG